MNKTRKEIIRPCNYPHCYKESEYSPRKKFYLCEEHYNLWKFIDELLFNAIIEINLRRGRFEEEAEGR